MSLSWTHRLKVLHSQLGIVGFFKAEFGHKGPRHTRAKGRDRVICEGIGFSSKGRTTDMVCKNLRQACLLQMGLAQIPANRETM